MKWCTTRSKMMYWSKIQINTKKEHEKEMLKDEKNRKEISFIREIETYKRFFHALPIRYL